MYDESPYRRLLCWTCGPSAVAPIAGRMHGLPSNASVSAGATSSSGGGRGRGAGRGRSGGRGGYQRGHSGSGRGNWSRGGGGGRRSNYQGSGIALTNVEPGYRYYKKTFLLNPWSDLERDMADAAHNSEEIDIQVHQLHDESEEEAIEEENPCQSSQMPSNPNATGNNQARNEEDFVTPAGISVDMVEGSQDPPAGVVPFPP
jgi:hypothetical protein